MSGIDERLVWQCFNCGKGYKALKIIGDDSSLVGKILTNKGLVMLCTSDIMNMTNKEFKNQYLQYFFSCDVCRVFVDKRSKEWVVLKDIFLKGFENRMLFVDGYDGKRNVQST